MDAARAYRDTRHQGAHLACDNCGEVVETERQAKGVTLAQVDIYTLPRKILSRAPKCRA